MSDGADQGDGTQTNGGGRRGRGRPPGAGVVDEEELLDLALRSLAAGGYRALTMRGLARELGVSLRSVQHRHATKDDLWKATVDHAVGRGLSLTDEDFPTALRRRIADARAYPGLMTSLLTDDAPGHEARLDYVLERLRPTFLLAQEQIAEGTALGLTREIDVGVLIATMLVGVGAMAALPERVRLELGMADDSGARLAEGLADIVLFGVIGRG